MTLNWVRVEKKTEFVGVSRPQALARVSSICTASIQTCASVSIGALGEVRIKMSLQESAAVCSPPFQRSLQSAHKCGFI